MVVTCASSSVIITPAYPTSARPTRADVSTHASTASASSDRNSDELHGRGYTCCSMRSTERTWRRRIGCTVTVSARTSGSAAISGPTVSAATVPRDLGVALAQVQRTQLGRLLELLALGARRRQLHERGDARRGEAAARELRVLERGELVREPLDRRRRRATARAGSTSRGRRRARPARAPRSRTPAAPRREPAGSAPRTPRGGGRRAPRRSGARSGAAGRRRGRGSGCRPRGCAAPGPSPWRW